MADYTTFRDVIKEQVAAVVGTGNVHSHLPYAADVRALLQKFMVTIDGVQQLRGWWVERQQKRLADADVDTMGTGGTGTLNYADYFVIIGVMSYHDARDTDAIFGDLVDDVILSLALMTRRPTDYFPGAWQVTPPRLRVHELRMVGDVLCHYAEILLIPQKEARF